MGAGLFLGAGSWFSYATIPILAGVLLIALSGPKQRRTGDLYGALAVVVIPALCLTAPLLWNAEQDWIPIAGGTFRTVWEFGAASSLRSLTGVLRNFFAAGASGDASRLRPGVFEWWEGGHRGALRFLVRVAGSPGRPLSYLSRTPAGSLLPACGAALPDQGD
jgi:hypothetical protein